MYFKKFKFVVLIYCVWIQNDDVEKDVWINNDEECEGCSRWCKNNQWVVSMDCYLYTFNFFIDNKKVITIVIQRTFIYIKVVYLFSLNM
jgi:hypothetical protein